MTWHETTGKYTISCMTVNSKRRNTYMVNTAKMPGWQHKVLEAARENTTQLGTILGAALHYEFEQPPRFSPQGNTTSDGFVMCSFTQSNGTRHNGAFVGSIADVVSNTVGIAAHCKLNPDERKALFVAVQGWIGHDVYGNARNDFGSYL